MAVTSGSGVSEFPGFAYGAFHLSEPAKAVIYVARPWLIREHVFITVFVSALQVFEDRRTSGQYVFHHCSNFKVFSPNNDIEVTR